MKLALYSLLVILTSVAWGTPTTSPYEIEMVDPKGNPIILDNKAKAKVVPAAPKCSSGAECFKKAEVAYKKKKQTVTAIQLLGQGCDKKHAQSCDMFSLLRTVVMEDANNLPKLEIACSTGDGYACITAGEFSIFLLDRERALENYEKGCKRNMEEGCKQAKAVRKALYPGSVF